MHRGTMIVTGASRGIGAAVARLGGAAGFAVAVNFATDENGANAVAAGIEAAGGRALARRPRWRKPCSGCCPTRPAT